MPVLGWSFIQDLSVVNSMWANLCLIYSYLIFIFHKFSDTLALTIPYLAEFISLVGAIGGTSLALIFPPLLELVTFHDSIGYLDIFKNIVILVIGFTGVLTGTYVSCREIVLKFMEGLWKWASQHRRINCGKFLERNIAICNWL